jgi:hypothetical protein
MAVRSAGVREGKETKEHLNLTLRIRPAISGEFIALAYINNVYTLMQKYKEALLSLKRHTGVEIRSKMCTVSVHLRTAGRLRDPAPSTPFKINLSYLIPSLNPY